MYKELFRGSPLLILPLIALAIFLGVYFLTALRVLGKKRGAYDSVAGMPLLADERALPAPAEASSRQGNRHD